MNVEDFREQLERMAGPAPHVTPDARQNVRRRVTGARRKRGIVSAASAVLVAAVVAAGVRNATESKDNVRTITSTTASAPATGPQCDAGIATVPADQVPSDVQKWASGAPVVGGGALWTARSILLGPVLHDSDVWRMKVSWLTRPLGLPEVSARQLDGSGTFTFDANRALDQRGFWITSSLVFSAAGCWEVTASFDQSTIRYRILIGDPPRPLAIGTITGTLEAVGGPAPGLGRSIVGTVQILRTPATPGHIPCPAVAAPGDCPVPTVMTDGHGGFSIDVPVGTYDVSGTSLSYQGGNVVCAEGPVGVRAGTTTRVDVSCQER